jgi:hypothetical protein
LTLSQGDNCAGNLRKITAVTRSENIFIIAAGAQIMAG